MDNQNSYGCRVSRMRVDLQPLSGNAGDAPQGRSLLERLGPAPTLYSLAMDRAYEGNEIKRLSRSLGYEPVVLPNPNRLEL